MSAAVRVLMARHWTARQPVRCTWSGVVSAPHLMDGFGQLHAATDEQDKADQSSGRIGLYRAAMWAIERLTGPLEELVAPKKRSISPFSVSLIG